MPIEVADKVRLSDKVLSSNVPFPERCYGLMLVLDMDDASGFCRIQPYGIGETDYSEHSIHIDNLTLVEKGVVSWGSPVSGNHDPMDYVDCYDGCEDDHHEEDPERTAQLCAEMDKWLEQYRQVCGNCGGLDGEHSRSCCEYMDD